MSRIAACMVADMLEPVSPSGTGKTLSALMASRCSTNHAAPAIMAFFRSCPSKTLMRRCRWGPMEVVTRGSGSCIVEINPSLCVLYVMRAQSISPHAMAQSLNVYVDLRNRNAQHLFNREFDTAHDILPDL